MNIRFTKEEALSRLRKFYTGKVYPIVVATIIAIAAMSATEIFLAGAVVLLFVGACLVCDTARPLIITVVAFVFQMSSKYSPSPSVSANHDYYFTSWRLPIFIIYISLTVISLIAFFIKNKCYARMNIKRDILLIPIIVLVLAFLISGAFYDGYVSGLPFSLMQAALFSLFYFVFAYGFKEEESRGELARYFVYISAVVAGIMLVELMHLFITSDNIFVDGGINKVGVMLGWGSWTLIGVSLAMLIPTLFLGVMTDKRYWWAYFAMATAAYVGAVLSMSRNAQLFATLAYAACVIIAAFKSHNKLIFRVISVVGATLAVIATIVFFDKLPTVIAEFFNDNGRAEHAAIAMENFFSSPVFGVGFLNFESITEIPYQYAPMGPWPAMAHNTLLELLSATGVFGTLAYGGYRVASVVPVLKKPTVEKTLLFLSVLVILLSSLLDNFVFDMYPMFYSLIALSIIHKKDRES